MVGIFTAGLSGFGTLVSLLLFSWQLSFLSHTSGRMLQSLKRC